MDDFKVEATKFTLVGAANFVLTFVVFTVMLKVLSVDYLVSLASAWFIGMVFSYTLNFTWVFRFEQQVKYKMGLIKFFLAGLLSIALNILVLRSIVENNGYDPFYTQLFLIPFIVVFNFSTVKYWSLRPSSGRSRNKFSP